MYKYIDDNNIIEFAIFIGFSKYITYPHSDPTLIVTRHPTSSRTIYNYACATNSYDN